MRLLVEEVQLLEENVKSNKNLNKVTIRYEILIIRLNQDLKQLKATSNKTNHYWKVFLTATTV